MSACCICMEDYTPDDFVTDLPCSETHYFHTHCVADWIKTKNSCPMCRKEITHEAMRLLREQN
jgi:hypothetical protein